MESVRSFIPFLLLAVFLFFLLFESIEIRLRRRRFALRIHVNGTRGKSSVTEYIAAGLRASGKNPFAKITGVIPTMIFPDGSRERIRRRGGARVQEQIRMLRSACHASADTLVFECMSISPELQKTESTIVQPQIYVLTNIRSDHAEQMGRTQQEQADALCGAIPDRAIVVTAHGPYEQFIREQAEKKGSTLAVVDEPTTASSSEVPAGVHPVNVAIAQRVCEIAGCSPEVVRPAILSEAAKHIPAVFTFNTDNGTLRFINGFAVNDVHSAGAFLERFGKRKEGESLGIILHTRADRPYRTKQFAEWIPSVKDLERVIVMGTHSPLAVRLLVKNGLRKELITVWKKADFLNPVALLHKTVSAQALLIGFGNITGEGFEFLHALEKEDRHDN